MKVLVFLNSLGLGGTEKAACRWAVGLHRGEANGDPMDVTVLSLQDGPRRASLENAGIEVRVVEAVPSRIAGHLRELKPDVIHAHAPGFPHEGDVLGAALSSLSPRIPVVQTNIFGRLENPPEEAWTDFRLFISWTSCVQAARRSRRPLDVEFFRKKSVASYPVDPIEPPDATRIAAFREKLGVREGEVLFGRFSRPEPNKWTDLPLQGFRLALRKTRRIKLLLREPPPAVAAELRASGDAEHFLLLPATADQDELGLTMASTDAILHGSRIGESFGYGIAEPMNFGKPAIANSTPWLDQAQVELVRHGECGFLASTPAATARCIALLAGDPSLRDILGGAAKFHIRQLANPNESLQRVRRGLTAAANGRANAFPEEDLAIASRAAAYLDEHQFGHCLAEQARLRLFDGRVRLHDYRSRVLEAVRAPFLK